VFIPPKSVSAPLPPFFFFMSWLKLQFAADAAEALRHVDIDG
jgi:hypothetical protein